MTIIKLNSFGMVLTGREYGSNVAKKIVTELNPPFIFDFAGVMSLGSSFGDEIFKAAVRIHADPVRIQNAGKAVTAALIQIQSDLNAKFIFE